MGVNLMLLPRVDSGATILELRGGKRLRPEIEKLPHHAVEFPLQTPLGVFEEDNELWQFRETKADDYGEAFQWVTAGDLLTVNRQIIEDWRYENVAAWAYLAQLPSNTEVVLYWC